MTGRLMEPLRLAALAACDDDAVVAGEERLSHAMLARRVAALAERLLAAGLPAGAIVPIALENGADFVVALLGALAAGGRPLPLPPASTPTERLALLGLAAGAPVGPLLAMPGALAEGPLLGMPGGLAEGPLLAAPFDAEASTGVPDFGPAAEVLLATSGSTGAAKIARLAWPAVVWNGRAHAASLALGAGARVLVVSPLFHAAPLVAQLVGTLAVGGAVILPRGPFTPRGVLALAARERATALALTPAHAALFLRRAGAADGQTLDELRAVSIGAAPMPQAALAAFQAYLGAIAPAARLYVTYGLTEAGPRVTTLDLTARPDKAGTVGLPLPGIEARVLDPERPDPGQPLPPGAVGELWLRTPGRMRGYVGAPARMDDWLPTGDQAVIDEEGFITLRGRYSELILTGGASVAPQEVEAALAADPRVREAAVVGVPHPIYGEIVHAFVVPAVEVSEQELLAALGTRLAPYKLPRKVTLLADLPRTASGKVARRRLRP